MFCCCGTDGKWGRERTQVLKWRVIKLKAQEELLWGKDNNGFHLLLEAASRIHSGKGRRPFREMCVVAKWLSWESQLQMASHTWGIQLCLRRETICQWNKLCGVVKSWPLWRTRHLKHDSSGSVRISYQKFISWVYFSSLSESVLPQNFNWEMKLWRILSFFNS